MPQPPRPRPEDVTAELPAVAADAETTEMDTAEPLSWREALRELTELAEQADTEEEAFRELLLVAQAAAQSAQMRGAVAATQALGLSIWDAARSLTAMAPRDEDDARAWLERSADAAAVARLAGEALARLD